MFELQQKLATITSVNLRKELHGEERVGAVDIGVTLTGENNLLLMLDPYLVNAFYRGAASGQGELDGRLPDLKFPDLAMPMKWGYVGLGYEVALDYGMNDDKQLRFIGCQVDKFKLDLKAGGSVEIAMRIVAKPTDEAVGELYELLGGEAKLSLAAPIAGEEQQEEYPGDAIDDMFDRQDHPPRDAAETDVMYPRAVASVRATGNPTPSSLQTELKIGYNHAIQLLSLMQANGVITEADDGSGEFVVVSDEAAA